MPHKIYRPRVERLLRGDFRTDDLSSLFLFLRLHSYGGRCLEEIGNFVAHRDQREKGPVTQELRDWFTVFAFHIPALDGRYNSTSLPADIREYLDATFRRIDWSDLKKQSGLGRKNVTLLIPEIKNHIYQNKDGTLALSKAVSKKAIKLFLYLCNHVTVHPLFSDETLFIEFVGALKKNKLLKTSELKALKSSASFVTLFAISVMNASNIKFNNNTTSRLSAHFIRGEPLGVFASVLVPRPEGGPPIQIGQTIFATKLQASEHCEPELLEKHDDWANYALEVTANGKLGVI